MSLPIDRKETDNVEEKGEHNMRDSYNTPERNCENCVNYESCWTTILNQPMRNLLNSLPHMFELRSGWDTPRFVKHMRGITGQVCVGYDNGRTQRETPREKEYEGWDE